MLRDIWIKETDFTHGGWSSNGDPLSVVVTYADGKIEQFEYPKVSLELAKRMTEQVSVNKVLTESINTLPDWGKRYLASLLNQWIVKSESSGL